MKKEQSGDLRPVMFAGTGSDAGKSIIATAFCRIFRQDGYTPAPFKAQNMALNSFVTPDGLELGRAQAVQAEAAGVPCHTDMNPLLLKPSGDCTSQIVLNGRPAGNQTAQAFFSKQGRQELIRQVHAAYNRLAKRYNPIVLEGAGSISELNLRNVDLVNLPMARHAGAPVILVADIDRGGVFASVYGSIMLQTEEDRRLIKAILINKFRGDIRLFANGVKMLEDLCGGIPVIGVVPWYNDIYIEEEDRLILKTKKQNAALQGKINIAVVLLRHMSNFTDFNVLERDDRVHLFYTSHPDELQKADIILIPGTKNTLDDLCHLRQEGLAQAILQSHRNGASVMGICGGYQIMGMEISDPDHVEGTIDRLPGLGLLPVVTRLTKTKITRRVSFRLACAAGNPVNAGNLCHGYEIHMGETRFLPEANASAFTCIAEDEHTFPGTPSSADSTFALLPDASENGCLVNNRCLGTYLHGILDNTPVIDFLLQPFAGKTSTRTAFDYNAFKEEQYDKLAAHVRRHVNMELMYEILNRAAPAEP
jgi:adenosylcobyric acid synthase